ncbi:MAG: hypothetical protein HY903_18740 [Deltaproteobacteria bacterium]|nr:hypothetical protein [Deltaproteobacteria bacterium]
MLKTHPALAAVPTASRRRDPKERRRELRFASRAALVAGAALLAAVGGCGDDSLRDLSGALVAEVANPSSTDQKAVVHLFTARARLDLEGALAGPATTLTAPSLPVGAVDVNLVTYDAGDREQVSRWQRDVLIRDHETTEVVFDLSQPACVSIDCPAGTTYALRGANDGRSRTACVVTTVPAATEDCCDGAAACNARTATLCAATENEALATTICKTITGCEVGSPALTNAADGTPCATESVCRAGDCVSNRPDVGCADGTREGFKDLGTYPNIAACSGAWSEGGLTDLTLVPKCDRGGGNDSAHADGGGCGAADLCASGWHVCRGKAEIATLSVTGCDGAVPAGAPDKSLFFAVSQHSVNNSVCDDAAGDNDVFGCGNLGHTLAADKNCAPLNRALASTQANSCGYNEAEPHLGPWVCVGDAASHLHEGALVKKDGCPNRSCSYDGNPIGSADKGGVVCCKD